MKFSILSLAWSKNWGGNVLKQKLCTDYLSDECQGAIAEALTAERLFASGATVQYEPQLPSTTKRPDLSTNWGTRQVAFEVVFPALSFQDLSENRQLAAMLSGCTELLASGTLNIYLTEISPTADTVNAIVSAVRLLSNDTTASTRQCWSGRDRHEPDKHEFET